MVVHRLTGSRVDILRGSCGHELLANLVDLDLVDFLKKRVQPGSAGDVSALSLASRTGEGRSRK